jgi:hypothetical protein
MSCFIIDEIIKNIELIISEPLINKFESLLNHFINYGWPGYQFVKTL